MFDPLQIQTFKEAFTSAHSLAVMIYSSWLTEQFTSMIDADGDGFVSRSDVQAILNNLGLDASKAKVDAFFAGITAHSSNGNGTDRIPFASFVAMFAERMEDMDSETDLVEAFACLDESDACVVRSLAHSLTRRPALTLSDHDASGWIDGQELRKWLKDVGDRMSDAEVRVQVTSRTQASRADTKSASRWTGSSMGLSQTRGAASTTETFVRRSG